MKEYLNEVIKEVQEHHHSNGNHGTTTMDDIGLPESYTV